MGPKPVELAVRGNTQLSILAKLDGESRFHPQSESQNLLFADVTQPGLQTVVGHQLGSKMQKWPDGQPTSAILLTQPPFRHGSPESRLQSQPRHGSPGDANNPYHPWSLGSGGPCRNDGVFIRQQYCPTSGRCVISVFRINTQRAEFNKTPRFPDSRCCESDSLYHVQDQCQAR